MKRNLNVLLNILFLSMLIVSCRKDEQAFSEEQNARLQKGMKPDDPGFADNNMVMYWNEKTTTVLGAPMTQPSRTRYFAIVEIAVHDALNSIKPKYERFALLDTRSQFANPDAAVASAAYWAIKGLNRQGSFPLDTWYNESLATIPDGESKELGKALGKLSAETIIANRLNDGFTQVIATSTNPPDGDEPGEYRSTLRYISIGGVPTLTLAPLKFIPNWGTVVKPYVTESNTQFRPATFPHPVNSAEYTNEFDEVKAKGSRMGSTRTAEEAALARFWSENRPSIIWNNLARNAIATKKMDAWKTARLFAMLHTAMADGLTTALNANYYFYAWKPETAIRLAATDGNSNTSADAGWLPFLDEVPNAFASPPQPEYPSAFAMYGGVAAEILKTVFETDNTSIDLGSASLPGVVRHYTTFSQAARENSIAKIYAGWFFRKSVLDGEEMGRKIGAYVVMNKFKEE